MVCEKNATETELGVRLSSQKSRVSDSAHLPAPLQISIRNPTSIRWTLSLTENWCFIACSGVLSEPSGGNLVVIVSPHADSKLRRRPKKTLLVEEVVARKEENNFDFRALHRRARARDPPTPHPPDDGSVCAMVSRQIDRERRRHTLLPVRTERKKQAPLAREISNVDRPSLVVCVFLARRVLRVGERRVRVLDGALDSELHGVGDRVLLVPTVNHFPLGPATPKRQYLESRVSFLEKTLEFYVGLVSTT